MLTLDDIGLSLLRQIDETWEAFHVTRDEIGDVTYGGHMRESELTDRDIALDDAVIAFGRHVSFLYDNQEYDTREKTAYQVNNRCLDMIANMEFELRIQGFMDEDTSTEIAVEALRGYRFYTARDPHTGGHAAQEDLR